MLKGEFFSVIFALISLILSFIGYYFYIKSEIYKNTEDVVNNAEASGGNGKEKLKAATEQLYMSVPTVLKPLIGKAQIEAVIQRAFDKIEEYAKRQSR